VWRREGMPRSAGSRLLPRETEAPMRKAASKVAEIVQTSVGLYRELAVSALTLVRR
jgi:hypothetical protein